VPARFTVSQSQIQRRSPENLIGDEFADFDFTVEAGKTYHLQGQWNRFDRNRPYHFVLVGANEGAPEAEESPAD
jgi:hypothetical protein